MMTMRTVFVTSLAPETICTPCPIWIAESPSVAAVPNSVAMIAIMSMIDPARPSERSLPMSDLNTELSSVTRPRRYELYASAPPTIA